MSAAPLLPCPFCGSADVAIDVPDYGDVRAVRCRQCEAEGPYDGSRPDHQEHAVAAWNRRAPAPPSPAAGMVPLPPGEDYAGVMAWARCYQRLSAEADAMQDWIEARTNAGLALEIRHAARAALSSREEAKGADLRPALEAMREACAKARECLTDDIFYRDGYGFVRCSACFEQQDEGEDERTHRPTCDVAAAINAIDAALSPFGAAAREEGE